MCKLIEGLSNLAIILAALFSWSIPLLAQSGNYNNNVTLGEFKKQALTKGTLSEKLYFHPVNLNASSQVTVVTGEAWKGLAEEITGYLRADYQKFAELYGEIPKIATNVRLLDEAQFYNLTGAPAWTNAMFYKGEIIMPLTAESIKDRDTLRRSLRHEFSHAVVNSLSNGNCPGWLDEGIAQWAEGDENPALKPALLRWLDGNAPVSLNLLQGGFTRLESDMVPAAYAQSLYASSTMIKAYGFNNLSNYFLQLRLGSDKSTAFKNAFNISEGQFEGVLSSSLRRWHKRNKVDFEFLNKSNLAN